MPGVLRRLGLVSCSARKANKNNQSGLARSGRVEVLQGCGVCREELGVVSELTSARSGLRTVGSKSGGKPVQGLVLGSVVIDSSPGDTKPDLSV